KILGIDLKNTRNLLLQALTKTFNWTLTMSVLALFSLLVAMKDLVSALSSVCNFLDFANKNNINTKKYYIKIARNMYMQVHIFVLYLKHFYPRTGPHWYPIYNYVQYYNTVSVLCTMCTCCTNIFHQHQVRCKLD